MSQATAIAYTLVKVFVATCLAQLIAFGTGIFDLSGGDWKAVAAAGVAAVLVAGYKFLDPTDTTYGINYDELN